MLTGSLSSWASTAAAGALANPFNEMLKTIQNLGTTFIVVAAVMTVLNIVLLIWVAQDYSSRGGGGCGSCFWALVVFHFGILGLLCYIVVRPSKREQPQIVVQTGGYPPGYAPPSAAAPPPPAQPGWSAPPPAALPPPAAAAPPGYPPSPSAAPPPPYSMPAPAPAGPAHPAAACPNCRAPIGPGDRFCESCGAPLSGSRAPGAGSGQHAFTIGRAEGCDILYDRPQVSGRHALLTIGPRGATIEDQGSTNGTFVGGRRISAPTPIRPGDTIGFGSFTISYEELLARAPRR
jgi:hypothetical protein